MPRLRSTPPNGTQSWNQSESGTPGTNKNIGNEQGTPGERSTLSTCGSGETENTNLAEIQDAKSTLASASRDETGFISGPTPHITEEQFSWFSFRIGTDSDISATLATGSDPVIVSQWFSDPDFTAFYETVMENKREAVKYLIPYLNGKVLRRINEMLDSDKPQMLRAGINFTLRIQGLLIDKVQRVDPSKIEQLMESLRSEKPITIMDAQYKEL